MDRTFRVGITILIIILFYLASWLFLKEYFDNLYPMIIAPLFWIMLALFSHYFVFDSNKHMFEYRNFLLILLITASLSYVVINFALAVAISGFAANPYDNSMTGIVYNFWTLGIVVIMAEIVRSSLVNAPNRINQTLMDMIIVVTYVAVAINFVSLQSELSDIYGIFRFLGVTLVPLVILNSLLTTTVRFAGPLPGIMYQLILLIPLLLSPILPSHEWVINALLLSLVPFFTLLAFDNRYKAKEYQLSKKVMEESDIKGWILRFTAISITLLFFFGITPIYPINIITNSMYPKINVGDVVIVKKDKIERIKVGDIIQYRKDSYTIIHRVVKITKKDDIIFLNTKGDNNSNEDITVTTYKNLLGRVIVVIPKIGLPNVWLKDTLNQIDESRASEN